ncbi:hypothetical protein COCNU_14G002580 [Cocos nucifera]|uniref:Uncharacterized protein n=1 Tax=Cocos nucifera TaxID=13894 RepID=A0A8K0IUN5_COCNU|nr:hypothetical protein COCNU_14G002580 [Cocos nucifera]
MRSKTACPTCGFSSGILGIPGSLVHIPSNHLRKSKPIPLPLHVQKACSTSLASGWFIRIVVFFIERNFTLRKRVLYFVYDVRKVVQDCLWLGLILISWHYMFDKNVERETKSKSLPYVTKVLFCLLLVACVFRLIKTLLVKVLASSFHVSTYFDRIQESLFNQYVIEALSGPPLVELQNAQYEKDRMVAEVQKIQNAGVTIPSDLQAAALPSKSGRVIEGSGRGLMRRSMQMGKSIKLSRPMSRKEHACSAAPPTPPSPHPPPFSAPGPAPATWTRRPRPPSTTTTSPTSSSALARSGSASSSPASSGKSQPDYDEDIPDEFKREKFDFLTILERVSLILIVAALGCNLSIPTLERQTVWSLHLWKWELLVFVLICGFKRIDVQNSISSPSSRVG